MSITPLDEFKKLVPKAGELTEDQLTTLRDLIDVQADHILDSFVAQLAKNSKLTE